MSEGTHRSNFDMTTLGDDEWAGMDLSVRRGNDHDPSWFAGLTDSPTSTT